MYAHNYKGKLIVIEGGDGSGKTIQSELLRSYFQQEGLETYLADFPRHGHPAGYFVDKMLTGEYGTLAEQTPYRTSLFYALDRFDASFELKDQLAKEKVIISNRYLTSNIGHQGGKIPDLEKREEYIEWLLHLEYTILGIPTPDVVIYLHVPVEVSLELLKLKREREYLQGGKRDIHEDDIQHLKDAEASYLHCVHSYDNWYKISCMQDGLLRTPEAIHQEIIGILLAR